MKELFHSLHDGRGLLENNAIYVYGHVVAHGEAREVGRRLLRSKPAFRLWSSWLGSITCDKFCRGRAKCWRLCCLQLLLPLLIKNLLFAL